MRRIERGTSVSEKLQHLDDLAIDSILPACHAPDVSLVLTDPSNEDLASLPRRPGAEVIIVDTAASPRCRDMADSPSLDEWAADVRYVWVPGRPDEALAGAARLARGAISWVGARGPEPGAEVPLERDTVQLATFEQSETVSLALDQLAGESDLDVVVCDDGSSPEFLASLAERIMREDGSVWYCWQKNRGFRVAASRNNGLRLRPGRRTFFLDGDMIPLPDLLARHRACRSDALVVGNRLTAAPGIADRLLGEGCAPEEAARELSAGAHRSVPDDNTKYRVRDIERYGFHPWRIAFTCNVSAPGPMTYFDENCRSRLGGEDLEWSYRMWRDGVPVVVTEDGNAVHAGHKVSYAVNLQNASHEDLVLHAETLFYVIAKHREESFMLGFLDALMYYQRQGDTWSVEASTGRTMYEATAEYLEWRRASPKVAQAALLAALNRGAQVEAVVS